MLFNSLRVTLVYTYYFVDTSGFIEMLCENKDKPELQCNGKCQLNKVVENSLDDEVPFKDIDFKEITLFVVEQSKFYFINASLKQSELSIYNNLYAYTAVPILDHPPQV